ncbi:MAG: glycosyltransferase family 1 protein [Candidatus Saganbacteria bacterium]|nr:glycosyltransferase family 1 protein [Candidatus Saganbacteria bacterium]
MKQLVLDNIIFGLQRSGGISRYWQEILDRLIADDEFADLSFLEPAHAGGNIFRRKTVIPEEKKRHQLPIPSIAMQFLPVRLDAPAVFHSSYFRYAIGREVNNIVTVYDCIYERFRGSSMAAFLHKIRTRALRHADIVICISKSTANDVMKYYPYVSKDKIRVISLAAGDEFYKMKAIPDKIIINGQSIIKNSYLLYVGKRDGYKNFSVLIKAMGILKKKDLSLPCVFVVGGERQLLSKHTSLIKEHGVGDKVIRTSTCDAAELNLYYNCAKAYICTSLYEGFGLPVLEAFKAGCPVITANNSSLGEVAGDAALFFDAGDPDSLARQIESICNNVLADKFRKAGIERAKSFSWGNAYRETKQVYLSLL